MGMQQILLIVLSVIIVGVAIAVGITMFGTQALNANRQAIANDLNTFGAMALAAYKTPKSMGGCGGDFTYAPTTGQPNIYTYLGFDATAGTMSNDNGRYKITSVETGKITIQGLGTEKADGTNYCGGQIVIEPAADHQLTYTIKDAASLT